MTLAKKRTLWMILGVIVVIVVIAGIKAYQVKTLIAGMKAQKPVPVSVSTVHAGATTWRRQLNAVGSIAPVQGAMLSNELDGTVVQIPFASGAVVKQNDLLVQLDVSLEQAQLASAVAAEELAKVSLQRAQQLRSDGTNSQADLDAANAQALQAAAATAAIRATIAKKTIRAPFAGHTGIRQVNVGQFVKAGTAIVSLEALNPIYINFSLPQQYTTDLKVGQPVQVTVDAFPGETFAGRVSALNPQVDDATRNFQVQATLDNPGEKLKPGMYGSVAVALPHEDSFITLPETAIVYNPYGDAVYILEKSKDASGADALIARQQFVELGDTRGDQVAILKGVKPGDEIVTAGQIKLRNGSAVQVNNSVQPSANPAPNLPNT
jgi:membrane fusion protein (multidrug efflux system)